MAALCFDSQRSMNIGILLLGQYFKNISSLALLQTMEKTATAILSSATSLK